MKCALILCVFFTTVLVNFVQSWNELCREAIESTAMSAITYMRLRRLKMLLRGEDLVDYTWWADEVLKRIPESLPLHYQYQPDKKSNNFNFTCSNNLCLLAGIKYFFSVLMNSGYPVGTAKPQKFDIPQLGYPRKIKFSPSDCLKYLVVLLSDLHHPLHLDFNQPDSIATIPVDLSEFPVWENISMQVLNTKRPLYGEFLKHIYMPKYIEVNENAWYGSWTHVSTLGLRYSTELELFNNKTVECFEVWAAETASLNNTIFDKEDFVYPNDTPRTKAIRFTERLDSKLGFLMRLQIVIAGARVAIVVNYILSHREIAYDEQTGIIIQKPELEPRSINIGYYLVKISIIFLALALVLLVYYAFVSLCKRLFKDKGLFVRLFLSKRYQPVNKLPE